MPAPKLHADRDPDFVYVIYIAASPQKIWDALTDNQTERAWWAHTRQDSTFQAGDPILYRRAGNIDISGEILEREEPNRLVYTFQSYGPGPQHDEGPSIVTYEIQANGNSTMLKVTHSNFPADSRTRKSIQNGWPAILSGLKTVLEGGKAPEYANWGEGEAKAAQARAARETAAQQ